jgi:hypothetical protein
VHHIHRQPECRIQIGLLQHYLEQCTPDLGLPSSGEEDDDLGIGLRSELGGEERGKGGELVLARDQGEGLGDGLVRGDIDAGEGGDVLVGRGEDRSCHLHEEVSHRTKFMESTMTTTDLADGVVHRGGEQQSLPTPISVSVMIIIPCSLISNDRPGVGPPVRKSSNDSVQLTSKATIE